MRLNRSRIALIGLVLAIGGSSGWWGPWTWRKLHYVEKPVLWQWSLVEGEWIVGLCLVERSKEAEFDNANLAERASLARHDFRMWYLTTGLLQQVLRAEGSTVYHRDGSIEKQHDVAAKLLVTNPPWIRGEADQTEPSLPDWLRKWAEEEIARTEAGGEPINVKR